MKSNIFFILLGIGILSLLLIPHTIVNAQDNCGIPDASGGVTPCPDKPGKKQSTPTTLPTFTLTLTSTSTPTSTQTPTSTATIISAATNTLTITPTSTPLPPSVASAVLPGAGIGIFILLLITGIFLPIGQKIRVAKRGY